MIQWFKKIIECVTNQDIIRLKDEALDKAEDDIDRMVDKYSELSLKYNTLGSEYEAYQEDLKNGNLVRIPKLRNPGDKIYYIGTDTLPDAEMANNIVVAVYGAEIRRVIELTVDHIAVKYGLVYYVVTEVNTLFYVNDPLIATDLNTAINMARNMPKDSETDIFAEYSNRVTIAVKPYTFNIPFHVGSSIFHKIYTENENAYFYEYRIIGFKYDETDGFTVIVIDKDDIDIEYISINDIGTNWSLTDS